MDLHQINVLIHFTFEGKIAKILTNHVPRLDDEVRFKVKGEPTFFKVTKVVWVYDEPECLYSRVNIAVDKLKINDQS